jgi:hypothetical protein
MLIDISSSKSSITFPKYLQSAPNRVLAMKQHIFQAAQWWGITIQTSFPTLDTKSYVC